MPVDAIGVRLRLHRLRQGFGACDIVARVEAVALGHGIEGGEVCHGSHATALIGTLEDIFQP